MSSDQAVRAAVLHLLRNFGALLSKAGETNAAMRDAMDPPGPSDADAAVIGRWVITAGEVSAALQGFHAPAPAPQLAAPPPAAPVASPPHDPAPQPLAAAPRPAPPPARASKPRRSTAAERRRSAGAARRSGERPVKSREATPAPGCAEPVQPGAEEVALAADQHLGEVIGVVLAEVDALAGRLLEIPGFPMDAFAPELQRFWQKMVVLHNASRVTAANLRSTPPKTLQ